MKPAIGARGSLARTLVESGNVLFARVEPLGLAGFVLGSGDNTYEVRLVRTRALEATSSCPDFLKTGELCKHGVALLVALKQEAVQIEPAVRSSDLRSSDPAGQTAGQSESTSSTTTLLRALRLAEREAKDAKIEADAESKGLWSALHSLQAKHDRLTAKLQEVTGGLRGVGTALDILGAYETLLQWTNEIDRAQTYVCVIAFTFDLLQVVNALMKARKRLGPHVRVIFDRNMFNSNQTKNQRPAAIQLRANGVQVRTGPVGRVHAKVLLTDSVIMLGSTNSTAASQQNEEWTVAIEPTDEGSRTSLERYNRLWSASQDMVA